MIRIDENTYIDDTLVTCAEYQLFIDEMREQGKYYQPDHWTSYQFPEGQAHAPIVGVRFSDAIVFCDWLTQREAGERSFRPPTYLEAEHDLLTKTTQSTLGYWIIGSAGNMQLTWVGHPPINPRFLDYKLLTSRDVELDNLVKRSLDRTVYRYLDIEISRDVVFSLTKLLRIAKNSGRIINHVYHLSHDLLHFLDLVITRTRINNNYTNLARANALAHDIVRKSVQGLKHVDYNQFAKKDKNLKEFIHRRENLIDEFCDVYTDIFTLHERIAGRSPAFESIRLVKERVKS
jgi:hypothetical protein